MARGRHSIRATNRLARLDHGLFEELRQKIKNLEADIAEANQDRERMRRQLATIHNKRASEISQELLDELHAAHVAMEDAMRKDRLEVAEIVFRCFRGRFMPDEFVEVALPVLIPDLGDRRTFTSRYFRKAG